MYCKEKLLPLPRTAAGDTNEHIYLKFAMSNKRERTDIRDRKLQSLKKYYSMLLILPVH